jgi:phosphoserine phosphatase
MERPKLVVFDLNKTLIEENSWLSLNLAMGVTQAEDDQLMSWGQEGIITDAQGQAIICSIYQKRGNPTRHVIMETLQAYTYRDGAKEVVAKLGEMGFELALLSGSMDILVEHIAKELHIKHWACNNRFVFDPNDVLQRIETVDNDITYKDNQLKQLCSDLGIEPQEALCVGDGANDASLFATTGNGVTFQGSPIASQAKHVIKRLDDILTLLV